MADLLDLSARFVDAAAGDDPTAELGPPNRITLELSEVADGIAVVESFSHVVAFATDDGLVLFDASLDSLAPHVLRALRAWDDAPVHTLVYTHGHVDHVGGAPAILAEAAARGRPRPAVVAHEAVPERFARYGLTDGYNGAVNARQFGTGNAFTWSNPDGTPAFFADFVGPTVTYRDEATLDVGGTVFELHHGKGETDDHTWTWVPARRAVSVGDLLIWVFPNAGNPQKVQRHPREWAEALRRIAALRPELLLPAHGLPIAGAERIARVLDETATVLESLVAQTLELMNAGATLDTIVHAVRAPAELLERPYLRPVYDEPEFVVRNIWRLYGGWYDGNPARLKPAPDAAVAAEVAALAGGVAVLADRARALADDATAAADPDGFRLACQLAEWAVQADPHDPAAAAAAAEVYRARRHLETSLMAKGIYGAAAARFDADDGR
ncbi:MAG: MBL fold metallo-hydrolase [Acidimicrobiales bacterium]|nr:MBL fold metallo-hydrolase [Acidimicrobiales bacterium]